MLKTKMTSDNPFFKLFKCHNKLRRNWMNLKKTCHYTKKHIISFLFAVRLYLAPPMLKLLHQKYRMERREGVGKEVGQLEIHDMLTNNLSFSEIHKKFRRYHTVIAVGNLLTVVCTFVHLHYLASKIVAI